MQRLSAPVVLFTAVTLTSPALARGTYFVPEPGDNSLKSKCRSEASMMGYGGKSFTVHMEENRELRRRYFRDCMHRGG
ncbi:hypothetical protein GGR33_004294 [Methylobacterium brachythecii]|uniref:Uncharacterized protein n=1 Tax=Methylobacterium brachythecii TaxID=1176177 RepID=A0A7W6AQC3_9HYPH|nr:hypothetical protein [Methylobacterium brachythecii]GLS45552.1 hypothetical protein GCM10007884_35430 [Methylobacterium brachythecii]